VAPPPPPAPAECVRVPAGTEGAVKGADNNYYVNVPAGKSCGEAVAVTATPTPAPCTEVPAGTSGGVVAPSNGKTYLNPRNGNPEECATPAAPAGTTSPPAKTEGTLAATKTKQAKPLGTTKAKAPAEQPRSAAPLATTKQSASLPFTGVELLVFALVGAGLLASGVLLRATARRRPSSSS
jgi:hypothetical protein